MQKLSSSYSDNLPWEQNQSYRVNLDLEFILIPWDEYYQENWNEE